MGKLSTYVKKILRRLMDQLMPGCDVVSRKISESLDRPLSLRDRLRIRLHLMFCTFCTRYRRQLMEMRNMLESNRQKEEDPRATGRPCLSDQARQKIKRSLLPPENR
jgi:hypothetical protein